VWPSDFTVGGKPPYPQQPNGKWACLVCRRQFADDEKLSLHINESELHKESMTKARAEGKIEDSDGVPAAPVRSNLNASGLDAAKIGGILGAASKLQDKLREINEQKVALQGKLQRPAAQPLSGSGSAVKAMLAFEKKIGGGSSGYVPGQYRDRAKERRERTGKDSEESMPVQSVKRAREINNNIDWKCGKCGMVNFARVIVCNKCGAEVNDDTEYLVNHLQEKRHKAIMQMVRATNPEMARIAEDNNRALGATDSGPSQGQGDDRRGLGY